MLYELPSFEHIDVKSVEETRSLLQQYGDKGRVIAGGSDLLGLMKDRVTGPELKIPEVLINIKPIPEMSKITYDEETGLRIGAGVTLNRLVTSDLIQKKLPILSQAAQQVATTQIRNMGTIGGNICQRPRCMYFRNPDFVCYKKGGTTCYAVTGDHRYYHAIMEYGKCVMSHPSDMAPALLALKARAVIATSRGERQIPLQDFFLGPKNFAETILKPDEFLVEIQVPNQEGRTHQLFLKHRIRKSSDFALSSVATVAHISNGSCEDIRIVLGGIAPFPILASKAEKMLKGKRLDEELISQAAAASVEGAHPLSMNRYKVDLTKALVNRNLMSIWHQSGE